MSYGNDQYKIINFPCSKNLLDMLLNGKDRDTLIEKSLTLIKQSTLNHKQSQLKFLYLAHILGIILSLSEFKKLPEEKTGSYIF